MFGDKVAWFVYKTTCCGASVGRSKRQLALLETSLSDTLTNGMSAAIPIDAFPTSLSFWWGPVPDSVSCNLAAEKKSWKWTSVSVWYSLYSYTQHTKLTHDVTRNAKNCSKQACLARHMM